MVPFCYFLATVTASICLWQYFFLLSSTMVIRISDFSLYLLTISNIHVQVADVSIGIHISIKYKYHPLLLPELKIGL